MKALILGAGLAAVLGAPALAQSYDQNDTDPYYDQGPPQTAQPPPQSSRQGGYDQPNGYYGQHQPPYAQGNGDEDENGDDDADQGYGEYQPPPAPPAGEPGFQNYQGEPQGAYAPNGADARAYGQYPPRYGYSGGQYASPRYGYQRGYGQYAPQYGYGYAQPPAYGAHPTGRTGPSWRNYEGQSCVWREMTWQDQYGRPAYHWVPRCS